MNDFDFEWQPGTFASCNQAMLEDCSRLYSKHYGDWSEHHPVETMRCKNVRLSANEIAKWLKPENSNIYLARYKQNLIGYAIAVRAQIPATKKVIAWITQLVVHRDYRNSDVAKNLLYSAWGFSNDFAWGLISASPYAVRALEKATRRRCNPIEIKENIESILQMGAVATSYITPRQEHTVNTGTSKINTEFYVDHSTIDFMLERVTTDTTPWTLGHLEEGWEWIAFTFNNQPQIPLKKEELNRMLETSDSVVQSAYDRMKITTEHKWAGETDAEVDFIINECGLCDKSSVIDFGCGNGRHAISLAKRKIPVLGIDYAENHIAAAKKKANGEHLSFQQADCRHVNVGENSADAVICLYDVVGSYADDESNLQILRNLYRHLKPGGLAIISVMNYDLTLAAAKNKFVLDRDSKILLSLPASNTMEKTGDVFNPEYYAVDTEKHIVYRKEQFQQGNQLPIEMIVRDRRFTQEEITSMCEQVGFNVLFTRRVKLGKWAIDDKNGKEILIKCQKRETNGLLFAAG